MTARAGNPTRRPRKAMAAMFALLILAVGFGGAMALVRFVQTTSLRAELQAEADQAALASAATLAGQSAAGSIIASETINATFGYWDAGHRRFVAGGPNPNAVETIVRGPHATSEEAGRRFSQVIFSPLSAAASAVAIIRPRDMVFVVDLSSAMAARSLAAASRLLDARQDNLVEVESVAALRDLYQDLGYESLPGPEEPLGAPWAVEPGAAAWDALTAVKGPLSRATISAEYRIVQGDSVSVRWEKACRAVIDSQILRLMPKAMPDPRRSENREYWAEYLGDLTHSGGDKASIGYASYVRFMLSRGRNEQAGSQYVPLSQHSEHCPWHVEQLGSLPLRFPPRVEPMHQVQRALAEAIRTLQRRNDGIEDPGRRDRVAIVSFDWPSGGARVHQPLTSDYSSAIRACARLQAVGSRGVARTTESGLRLAGELLREVSPGVCGHRGAEQVVILVTASDAEPQGVAAMAEGQTPLPDHVVRVDDGGGQVRARLESIVNTATVALIR